MKKYGYDPTGTHHSEETKNKMRETALRIARRGKDSPHYGKKITEEHKAAIAEANRKRVVSAETRKKMSDAHKGKTLSESTKLKMSESRRGSRNPNYGKRAAHGKGSWYTRKSGEKVWLRSSWELATAKFLDENNYNWDYEVIAYPVKYVYKDTLKEGTYRPDFFVDDVLWEVKGYWRDDAKFKFEAFKQQYPQIKIELLDMDRLLEMGILDEKSCRKYRK